MRAKGGNGAAARGRLLGALVGLLLAAGGTTPALAGVTVFAAASTAAALDDVAAAFAARGMGTVRASYAASSLLAKQIVNGAPADIYISASTAWMDFLAREDAVVPGSRFELLGNRLALVAPADSRFDVRIVSAFPLAAALDGGRLAMGDPDHVPAGVYAKAALTALGVWRSVAPMVAPALDVRAALVLVQRGEAAAGIVYATDVALVSGVRVVGFFPGDSHPPITYPAAMVAGRGRPEVRRYYRFLKSPIAAAIFVSHGFAMMPAAGP